MTVFCLNCGSWIGNGPVLCAHCTSHFLEHFNAPLRVLNPPLRIWSQFYWDEANHSHMAQLLNYTKGLKSCKQAKRLPLSITQMLEKLLLQNTSWKTTYAPCNLVWIPIPSLSYPKRSHYLCEIFIHHLGGYLYDCLTISDKGWQQKRKSEKDRWQITFQFKESMASPVPFRISTYNKNTIYFLIDDVITTGATMQKAAQTLRDNLHSLETPSYSDPDNNTGQIYGVTIFSRLRTQA